jgi:hypothetical protein
MKKNLRDEGTAKELIERVNGLAADRSALWGKMQVTEMLHHCNKATRAILDGRPSNKPSSLKQQSLKFLFLHVLQKFPKNVEAPARVAVEKISRDRFEVEKQHLIDLTNEFVRHPKSIEATHPIFGNLNDRQWGVFTWMHLDHHLRQFGV